MYAQMLNLPQRIAPKKERDDLMNAQASVVPTGILAGTLLALAISASAQFFQSPPKTVGLEIPRPPQFGLTVKRIAFGQPGSGPCAAEAGELVDRMILPDFQQNQMDVIEREALNQIMAEHNLNQSGNVDTSGAAKLGTILGPSALVIVNVNNCSHEQQPLFEDQKNELNGRVTRIFISKTRYSLEGSIRVVDLTTGQVMGSHNFESKPQNQNSSESGQPEYPPIDELKDSAMQEVKSQVHAMFFPSSDTMAAVFYDDKDCNLKQSYELFRNGDRDGALRLAENNLEQCKSAHKKDKSLARASYDVALLHCLHKDYDKAKELFTAAMDGKGAEAVGRTSEACNRAREGEAALAAYRARVAQIPAPGPIVATTDRGPLSVEKKPSGSDSTVPGPVVVKQAPLSAEDRLKKLDALYKKGLINKKEYDQKRAEILNDI
jgi:hypothetical protein